MKKLLFAFLCSTFAAGASATTIDVAVMAAGDGVYNQYSSPYGSGSSFDTAASPNSVSYYYYSSGGTSTERNTAYAQFSLSAVSALENITSVTLHLNILGAAMDGNLNSPGKINHSTSDGTGNASQKLAGNEYVATVQSGTSGWTSFDVTPLVLGDLARVQNWSAFSFDYDGSYHTWDYYRTSGFSFSSAEQGSAAFLRFTTSDGGGDRDLDGIPDWWELEHFGGDTNAVPDAVCSNGVNTVAEAYVAGLDPNDCTSMFRVSIVPPGVASLEWNTVSGRVYSVYQTTNLLSGFQCLETNIPWTQGSFTNLPMAAPCGFYRIGVQLEE